MNAVVAGPLISQAGGGSERPCCSSDIRVTRVRTYVSCHFTLLTITAAVNVVKSPPTLIDRSAPTPALTEKSPTSIWPQQHRGLHSLGFASSAHSTTRASKYPREIHRRNTSGWRRANVCSSAAASGPAAPRDIGADSGEATRFLEAVRTADRTLDIEQAWRT